VDFVFLHGALRSQTEKISHLIFGYVNTELRTFETAKREMCNLYSQKKSQAEVRDLAKAMVDCAGNMPSLPAIFPNGRAPIVQGAQAAGWWDDNYELIPCRESQH
jgi:hypothetical protein